MKRDSRKRVKAKIDGNCTRFERRGCKSKGITMIKKQNEESFAASSLNSKSMAYDDFQEDVDQAIAHFQKLNATQKERYLDAIQQKMNDAATGKGTFGAKLHKPYQDGAGAPDAAERNRKFNREEFDFIEWENDLADTLEAMGFTKEAREKA